ncbi:MAG: thioredoxin domain-containing protein [Patescibacteria group bacterium]|jgi:protein-disulfide isomerase
MPLSTQQKYLIGGIAALVVIIGAFFLFKPKTPNDVATPSASTPTLPVTTTTAELVVSWAPLEGPFAAKVTIVEFLDFQCPGCGGYHPVLKQMREEFKGRIKFVARHFPLVEIHENALGAAIASVCAQRQNKFFEYADVLFANQDYLRRNDLEKYAEELGLDTGAFNTCLDDKTAQEQVARDRQAGEAIGVKFTPSIFINGTLMEELVPPEELRNIINRELRK